MSHNGNEAGLGTVLRDLGNDGGRPLLPEEGILAAGKQARRRRRVARAGGAVAACAALALGAIALPSVSLFGQEPAATATAATYLRGVADRMPTSGDPVTSPWWKVEYERTISGQKPVRMIFWRGKRFKDNFTYLPDGEPESSAANPVQVGVPEPGPDFARAKLAALPGDPAELRKILLAKTVDTDGGPLPVQYATPDRALVTKAESLLVAPVPPRVRRALFLVLADSKLATLVGPVKDGRGRSGTAVDFGENENRTRFIFAEDGTLLETTTKYEGGEWTVQGIPTTYEGGEIRSTVLFQGGADAVDK